MTRAVMALALVGWLMPAGCGRNACERGQEAGSNAAIADHARESFRRVDGEDEIVAVLENGATVIARRMPSPAVSVHGCVRAGSMHEGEWLGGGLSHLLEHIVAGGTNGRRTERADRDLLEQIGNDSNAFTGPDRTVYFVNTTPEHLEKAVDLVTGWMLTARITVEEFERERRVVQREMEMDGGDPDWVYYHLALRNRYLVSPARVPVIGVAPVVQRIARDDLWRWYAKAYQPGNMVFAVVGDIDPEAAVRTVRRYVNVPAGTVAVGAVDDEPPPTAPRTAVAGFPDLGEARLQLAFPTVRLTHGDLYALDVLAVALGGGESAVLVEELRDARKLVSSVSAFSDTPYYVAGTFQIDMRLAPENIAAATAAVLEIIERVRAEGLPAERMARAKARLRVARAMAMQRAESVAESLIADYVATGDHRFSERYVDRIERVTADQIRAAAVRYLDRSVLLTTALLPQESLSGNGPAGAGALFTMRATATASATRPQCQPVIRALLGDGTTLLLRRTGGAPVVAVRMYARGGLTEEDDLTNGIGNLAMQAVTRGTASRSAAQVNAFFDSIGATVSAACGNTAWSWSMDCMKGDLPAALEVFADVALRAAMPDAEIELLRKRLLAAIDSQDADWYAQAMRFFRQAYFGPGGWPYRFMPLGTRANVERFTAEEVRRWYARKVLKAPRVLAIFGDIEVEAAAALAGRHFGGLADGPRAAAPARQPAPAPASDAQNVHGGPPRITVERIAVRRSDNPQTVVVIGFDAPARRGDPAEYALTVARTLACGFTYPAGYLFHSLRGEGLVYDVNAFVMQAVEGRTPGALVVYAACEAERVNRVVDVILENIARLQGSAADMNEAWFGRAGKLIIASEAMEHETAGAQAARAALDELWGCGADRHERLAAGIAAVRPDDVAGLARRFLSRCTIVVNTNRPDRVNLVEGDRLYRAFRPVDLAWRGVRRDATVVGP